MQVEVDEERTYKIYKGEHAELRGGRGGGVKEEEEEACIRGKEARGAASFPLTSSSPSYSSLPNAAAGSHCPCVRRRGAAWGGRPSLGKSVRRVLEGRR